MRFLIAVGLFLLQGQQAQSINYRLHPASVHRIPPAIYNDAMEFCSAEIAPLVKAWEE